MRVKEAVRLRTKDVDFEQRQILIRDAKALMIGFVCCLFLFEIKPV
jgi:integrase